MLQSQALGQNIARRTSKFFVGHCPPHVYPHVYLRDSFSQAFPLCFCIRQAIKNWRQEWPGNEARHALTWSQLVLFPDHLWGHCTMIVVLSAISAALVWSDLDSDILWTQLIAFTEKCMHSLLKANDSCFYITIFHYPACFWQWLTFLDCADEVEVAYLKDITKEDLVKFFQASTWLSRA